MPGTSPPLRHASDPVSPPDRLQAFIVAAVTLVALCTALAVAGAPA